MYCSYCQKELREDKKSLFPPNALRFCSKKCLREHISSMRFFGKEMQKRLNTFARPNIEDFGSLTCFSTRLGKGFRSWFECSVAEEIVQKWGFTVQYEPHQITIDATHLYVPDFFFPDFGVWLEVKGEWRNGGKSKFERALDLLGIDRLLLVPQMYKSWFKQKKRW